MFTPFNHVGPVRMKKASFSTPQEQKNSRERATKAFAGWIWTKRGQTFQISWQNWPPFTKFHTTVSVGKTVYVFLHCSSNTATVQKCTSNCKVLLFGPGIYWRHSHIVFLPCTRTSIVCALQTSSHLTYDACILQQWDTLPFNRDFILWR